MAVGGASSRADPQRMCVGCRKRAPKPQLLRVVMVEGACIPDPHGRLPGRGASMHPDPGCLSLARRRRAFPRAFRVSGPLATGALDALTEGGPEPGPQQSRSNERARSLTALTLEAGRMR